MKMSGHTQMVTFQRYLNPQPDRLNQIAEIADEHRKKETANGKKARLIKKKSKEKRVSDVLCKRHG